MTLDPPGHARQSFRFLAVMTIVALAGVLSLLLAPFELLAPHGLDQCLFKLLSLIQPGVLAIVGVALGHVFAHRVGLDAPLLRAVASKQQVRPLLQRQVGPGLLGAMLSSLSLITYLAFVAGMAPTALELPLLTKLLYGGITEEIFARWGLMSLGVWLAAKMLASEGKPQALHFWIGNLVAAAIFSIGHLPLLFATTSMATHVLVMAVIMGNMLPALVYGWLFQARGLEAAMIAHAATHLVGTGFLAAA